jgi:hypothetical protein
MAGTFRSVFRKLLPWWLNTGEGELVGFSIATLLDAVSARVRLGTYAKFPTYAPPDALAHLGRDRRIVRGLSETDENYAARLLRYLDDWKLAGNPFALMTQLRAFLGADLKMRTVDNSGNWYSIDTDGTRTVNLAQGNWDWDGDADKWSRFWVIIYPNGYWSTITWGSGLQWGQPGLTWGSTATSEEVAGVRSIVTEWKPAGCRCPHIIIAFDNTSFDPLTGPVLPDGNWAESSKNSTGNQTASRLSSARYWKGSS